MLITRAPHRVSFFGGGSDFLDHIKLVNSHSSVFGMAIDRYSYVAATFPQMAVKDKFRISYSKTDNASFLRDLKHELAREVLCYFSFDANLPQVRSRVCQINARCTRERSRYCWCLFKRDM